MTTPAERDHREASRLVGLVHARTDGVISHDASALQLFRDARDVAEAAIPGPLGEAVAAYLALVACERGASGMGGSLGASKAAMAVALTVLDLAVPTDGGGA